jgi:L-alanine-DL-glutamate epimerase-like enolase superfamily enzyme
MEIPLSADHFGHIGVKSCIRLGKALEPYNMAWLEDMVPWYRTKLLKEIKESVNLPLATGEDIYLADGFYDLVSNNAVDIGHPDLAGAGGIFETKRIGDLCQKFGLPVAMHSAGSPICALAAVHAAAATDNFLALEHHSADIPWWQDLVEGIDKPLIDQGFIKVPEKPGLGLTLNEDLVKKHLYPGWPGEFDAAPELERYKGRVATSLWT